MRKIILLCGFDMLGSLSFANTWDETPTVAEDSIGCTITTIVRHYVNGEYSHIHPQAIGTMGIVGSKTVA